MPPVHTAPSAHKLVKQTRECDERLTRAFGLLGKRWSGIILGLLLQGPTRFAVLGRTVPGISERVLSQRLTELAAAGLVQRRVLVRRPLNVVYELTESGRAMGPGLQQLGEWAERYFRRPPPRVRARPAHKRRARKAPS